MKSECLTDVQKAGHHLSWIVGTAKDAHRQSQENHQSSLFYAFPHSLPICLFPKLSYRESLQKLIVKLVITVACLECVSELSAQGAGKKQLYPPVSILISQGLPYRALIPPNV